ncbi:hypothetical protein HPB49_019494 [Dermacentor silvarum]|uniref:Uncharacterized protein n=1 Tax=Dermacentor silvarum TaxID=543639 RepID=A0ACB8D7R3_DERSI|nr:hypothetical protein HPB49_019494 [Dermacentor silvarum]
MDTHTGLANLQAGKRPRDQTNSLATTQDSSGGDEPPPKAPDLAKASGPNATTGQQPADQPLEPQPGIATASERPESSEPPAKEPDATTGQDNMDQSESAAGGLAGKRPWDEADPLVAAPGSSVVSKQDAEAKVVSASQVAVQEETSDKETTSGDIHHTPNEDATPGFEPEESIADADSATSTQAEKRPRDQTNDDEKSIDGKVGGEEPPSKLSGTRRPSFKPRPSILDDPRSAAKPP